VTSGLHLVLAATLPTGHEFITAIVTGILLGGLFAITALGLSLVFGVMRLINLAHGELLILGAYLAYQTNRWIGIDPLLSLLIVAPVVFLISLPVQRVLLTPLLDKGPEPALLTTFGLAVIAQNLFILIFSGDTKTLPASYANSSVSLLGLNIPAMYLVAFGLALVLCGGTQVMLTRSGLGRQIRATAENSFAASALGVNVQWTYSFVFGLAAAFAAVGGVIVGLTFNFTPTSGTTYLLTGFAVVVLGGLGSVKGTLLGAIILGVCESVGASIFGDGYRDFIGFVVFLVILGIRPQGLFGRRA
jgi:branched-chain amino acid transport system permease protein